jgi:hypothetical protein
VKRPPATSYCGTCGGTWTGADACHAPCCHDTFATLALFDAHRDGRGERGRCLDPSMVDDQHGRPVMEWRDEQWRTPT